MSRRFKLHLTTRCGCTRTIDHGAEPPPLEVKVALAPSDAQKRERVEALNLVDVAGLRGRVEVPRERFLLRIGTLNGPDELDELDALLETPVDREAVQSARRARERELIADEPLRPGVDRLLEEAAELGLKVAIVSSSTRDWVQ